MWGEVCGMCRGGLVRDVWCGKCGWNVDCLGVSGRFLGAVFLECCEDFGVMGGGVFVGSGGGVGWWLWGVNVVIFV